MINLILDAYKFAQGSVLSMKLTPRPSVNRRCPSFFAMHTLIYNNKYLSSVKVLKLILCVVTSFFFYYFMLKYLT